VSGPVLELTSARVV